jgi:predicted protein tyrosine phosphatase
VNSKLCVCDRGTAIDLAPVRVKFAVISIKNPTAKDVAFKDENLVGVLRLAFDDIDVAVDDLVPFNDEMAGRVLDFVAEVWDKVDILLVHCNMGQCRSPAIAAAIARIQEGSDKFWFQTKTPNRSVYRRLLQLAHSRGLME